LGSPLSARDEKEVTGVASSTIAKKKEVQDNSFHWKGHDHHLLGQWSDSGGCVGQETINSDVYIRTLQKLKERYWRV
jgi:hypothetical protein